MIKNTNTQKRIMKQVQTGYQCDYTPKITSINTEKNAGNQPLEQFKRI